jgi:L-cystine transport system ATP-binding protein
MFEAAGIKKSFGKNQVLKGLGVAVGRGQVVGIIGPSGSGKSTLLRCINLLEIPDAGRYTFGDAAFEVGTMKKRDMLALRRRTAMVFQQFNLFKYKTALENVMEGLVVVQKQRKAEAEERARFYLQKVGLADRIRYYPNQLSGGQQQRVAIARSLALNPELILFDEPTSALDPEMIGEVLHVIQDLAGEGHTMIIVSHEMRFHYEIAGHVIFIDDGLVLEEGSPREVFTHPQKERTRQFVSKISAFDDYTI